MTQRITDLTSIHIPHLYRQDAFTKFANGAKANISCSQVASKMQLQYIVNNHSMKSQMQMLTPVEQCLSVKRKESDAGLGHSQTVATQSSNHDSKRQKAEKFQFVKSLVDVSSLVIDSIWLNQTSLRDDKTMPLRHFVEETLKRSRASYSTLQTALFYLFRVKSIVQKLSVPPKESSMLTPPLSPIDPKDFDEMTRMPTSNGLSEFSIKSPSEPIIKVDKEMVEITLCCRRMFLASLIVASKFLQDRTYSNRAWSRISGLPISEINKIEMTFLKMIDHHLFINEEVFKKWSALLLRQVHETTHSHC